MKSSDILLLISIVLIIGGLFFLSQERILPQHYRYINPNQKYMPISSPGIDINHAEDNFKHERDNLRLGARSVDIEPDIEEVTEESEDRWEEFEDYRDDQDKLLENIFSK